jgi:hypothetical protein
MTSFDAGIDDATGELAHRGAMREIDARCNDGIFVRLLWHPATNDLVVTAYDARSGEGVAIPVRPETATTVYQHPFATAACSDTSLPAGPLSELLTDHGGGLRDR